VLGRRTILRIVLREGVHESSHLGSIVQMSIGGITTYYPVPSVQLETEAADRQGSMYIFIGSTGFLFCILESIAVVAAQTESQTWYRIVVDAGRTGINIANLVFVRTCSSIMHETVVTETLSIETLPPIKTMTAMAVSTCHT
jgi:hypothetical protein